MDTNEIKIRPATEADAAEILNIYAPYITDTAITFEYDVPTLEEFTGRIRHTLEKYPYLVAVRDSLTTISNSCQFLLLIHRTFYKTSVLPA